MLPQPGDLFGTRGGGWTGRIIRLGTETDTAHIGVWEKTLMVTPWGDVLGRTHEAFGSREPLTGRSGIRTRLRWVSEEQISLVSLARTDEERAAIVDASWDCVEESTGYDWWGIVAIAAYACVKASRLFRLHPVAWCFEKLQKAALRLSPVSKRICSNHAMVAALAARPELAHFTKYGPDDIHPGEFLRACYALLRADYEATLQAA